ncbi:MAG: 4-hydroxy-tetrahydrodipicolinate synthase [Planctomycetes bacterium]|nr:4-hydroxy-tetrahydrodipicolinate synthase [Planctomycetota bacterium]
MKPAFSGLGVALATPFSASGALDLPALRALVRHVVGGGVDFVVPLGTTGEAATIDERERDAVITAVLEEAGSARVCVGAGSNSTKTAAALVRRAQQLGAHGALVVTPYYNKPMPAGLVAHYSACADAAPGLPLVAYNVPGRTALNMTSDTMDLLWRIESVVALKESSGDLGQIGELARWLPPGKTLLAGDDNLAVASIAVGAEGLVSVLGNVLPREMKALVDAARAGRRDQAAALNAALLPLMDALFAESNPIPVKAALAELGLCGSHLRLPLTDAQPATCELLRRALQKARVAAEGVRA